MHMIYLHTCNYSYVWMQIVKVESAFKLVAIKMPITITLLHYWHIFYLFLLHVFISINCNASNALEHVYLWIQRWINVD